MRTGVKCNSVPMKELNERGWNSMVVQGVVSWIYGLALPRMNYGNTSRIVV